MHFDIFIIEKDTHRSFISELLFVLTTFILLKCYHILRYCIILIFNIINCYYQITNTIDEDTIDKEIKIVAGTYQEKIAKKGGGPVLAEDE